MESEMTSTVERKYRHLWLLLLLPALYFAANQDRIRFGLLSHRLFKSKLESKSPQNVRTDNAYLFDIDAYNEIIRGGKKFLPFLVFKLQMDKNFIWGEALKDITGVDVRIYARDKGWKDADGDSDALWLKWWAENQDNYSRD
jgi:hypothetical protein